MEKQKRIRCKALAWIEDKGFLFVAKYHDVVKGDDYYRSIGGAVEFGERSLDAVIREVQEELQTEIAIIAPPFVVENLFTCDGEPGHEINFLYPARFVDTRYYERKPYRVVETNGKETEALWVPISACVNGELRLVPEELCTWYATENKGHA